MAELTQIFNRITGFDYNNIQELFIALDIKVSEWSAENAKKEFDEIIKSRLASKHRTENPSFIVVAGIPCSGKTTLSNKLFMSYATTYE